MMQKQCEILFFLNSKGSSFLLLVCLLFLNNSHSVLAQSLIETGKLGKQQSRPNQLYFDTKQKDSFKKDDLFYQYPNNHATQSILLKKTVRKNKQGKSVITSSITLTVSQTNTTCDYNNGSIAVVADNGTPPYKYSIDASQEYSNTGNFTYLHAGYHTVYIQDAAGIRDSTTILLYNSYPGPSVKFKSFTYPSGCVANNGSFTLEASGGVPSYSYSYDLINFQSNPVFSDLFGGIYYYSVKDANGCIATHNLLLTTGCFSYVGAIAFRSCTNEGVIQIEAGSGTPPYFYSLDSLNFVPLGYFDSLGPGMHKLYTRDADGKIAVLALPMYKDCNLRSVTTVTDASCGKKDGSITLSSTNGVPPYTYSIDGINFQSSNIFTGLAPGNYPVTAKDATGLLTYVSAFINSGCPVIIAAAFPTDCGVNTGSARVLGTGGTAPYTYSINGILFQVNNQFDNLAAGNYTVTVKDAVGFKDSTIVTVTTNNCFTVTATGTDAVCSTKTGNITANCTYGTAPYLYSLDGVAFQADNIFSNLAPGDYTIYAKDNSNTITSTLVTIRDKPAPMLDIVTTPSGCQANDGIITVNTIGGTAPFEYSIDGVNFLSTSQFANLPAGTYAVKVKDANNCEVQQSVIVGINCINISTTQTDDSCSLSKGNILASASGGTAPYQYSINGGTFQSIGLFNNLIGGTYIIDVRDAGNQVQTKTILIKNFCFTLNTVAANTTCGKRNGIVTATGNGGNLPYQYSTDGINFQTTNIFSGLDTGVYAVFVKDALNNLRNTTATIIDVAGPEINLVSTTASCSNAIGVIVITTNGGVAPSQYSMDSINFQNNNVFSNLSAALYKVWVKDSNGCTASDTVIVSRLPVPEVFIGNDTSLCTGDSIILTAPLSAQYRYLWQDGTVSNQYVVQNPGTYGVNVRNQFNCSFSDTVIIAEKQLPAFNLGNDTAICKGEMLHLQVSIPGAFYQWSTGSNASSILVTMPGLYWLKINQTGCYKTDSITLSEKPLPVVDLGNDTIVCEGKSILLNAANAAASYLWQDGNANSTYLVTKQGDYNVKVTMNGCESNNAIKIDYQLKPIFTLGEDKFICKAQSLVITPNIGNANFVWQDGSTNKTFTVTKPGIYSLSATNKCGSISDSVLVTEGVCSLYIPTAFTPNGDSKNDVFKAGFGENITNYHLQIYNRFGQLVFETRDKNAGWDGKRNSKEQPAGAYVWFVQYNTASNKTIQQLKGTLLLIR